MSTVEVIDYSNTSSLLDFKAYLNYLKFRLSAFGHRFRRFFGYILGDRGTVSLTWPGFLSRLGFWGDFFIRVEFFPGPQ